MTFNPAAKQEEQVVEKLEEPTEDGRDGQQQSADAGVVVAVQGSSSLRAWDRYSFASTRLPNA